MEIREALGKVGNNDDYTVMLKWCKDNVPNSLKHLSDGEIIYAMYNAYTLHCNLDSANTTVSSCNIAETAK